MRAREGLAYQIEESLRALLQRRARLGGTG
jgi:hypothetical protein